MQVGIESNMFSLKMYKCLYPENDQKIHCLINSEMLTYDYFFKLRNSLMRSSL